jgi:phosphoserine aminotransferase
MRVLNFGPGPAALPRDVLETCKEEMLDFAGTGMSVLEISHRSKEFENVLERAIVHVKELLKVPDNYKILFMQGGATTQFSCVPLNLGSRPGKAVYLVTGGWSEKAAQEASKYVNIEIITNQEKGDKKKQFVNVHDEIILNDDEISYVYYCDNETVHGVEFNTIPKVPDHIPLVADMSSNIMTRKFDVSRFGIIFVGAQKNIGPSGVVLVISILYLYLIVLNCIKSFTLHRYLAQ